jgi:putative FmdB family regulatory protein
MPIYNFHCPECDKPFQRVLPHLSEYEKPCPTCKTTSPYVGKGPTTRIVEVRDNGLMPKKVEQLADIDEMVRERSTKKPDGEIV